MEEVVRELGDSRDLKDILRYLEIIVIEGIRKGRDSIFLGFLYWGDWFFDLI